jgi:hypothetical protein
MKEYPEQQLKEIQALKRWQRCPPTNRWSAMAFRQLQKKYPAVVSGNFNDYQGNKK